MLEIAWTTLHPRLISPGCLVVAAGGHGLLEIRLFAGQGSRDALARAVERHLKALLSSFDIAGPRSRARAVLDQAVAELKSYFEGTGRVFDWAMQSFRVPCDLRGKGSSFDAAVWKALREIRCGTVTTYGQLARALERPAAARAVGGAVGRNPFPIVFPCHRVVGSEGRLTGFSSGLRLKILLLEHEGVPLSRARSLADWRVVLQRTEESRRPAG